MSIWRIRKGTGVVTTGDRRVRFGPGDWVFLPPGLYRHQIFSEGARILSVSLEAEWGDGFPVFRSTQPTVLARRELTRLERVCEALAGSGVRQPRELGSSSGSGVGPDVAIRHHRYAAELLDELILIAEMESWLHPPPAQDARLVRLLAAMTDHPDIRPIPEETIRQLTGLGRKQVDRLMLWTVGHTVAGHAAEVCLEQARVLLTRPEHPIKAIAAGMGFGDTSHFCTWFRRQTGRTPGQFRKDHVET